MVKQFAGHLHDILMQFAWVRGSGARTTRESIHPIFPTLHDQVLSSRLLCARGRGSRIFRIDYPILRSIIPHISSNIFFPVEILEDRSILIFRRMRMRARHGLRSEHCAIHVLIVSYLEKEQKDGCLLKIIRERITNFVGMRF